MGLSCSLGGHLKTPTVKNTRPGLLVLKERPESMLNKYGSLAQIFSRSFSTNNPARGCFSLWAF
jgi:hypothetical protein